MGGRGRERRKPGEGRKERGDRRCWDEGRTDEETQKMSGRAVGWRGWKERDRGEEIKEHTSMKVEEVALRQGRETNEVRERERGGISGERVERCNRTKTKTNK